ncbi:hypothetical protein FT663_00169 [Candidozyma haemuli var. vulneris]|uniref:Uncharacterized protein n=1 Tax=Candidozyma haemuli TaxID=45357 RepID=A0A2V1AP77_9ASCO|nr:hypothetical protein CXQ85_001037 [[Candida] haemuloni]KAF3994199.1 hypothetical protein FT662_00068 [[Candida] haemuloni var. vulneris]KAF3995747.1 hypothetical protein FT663_00169 [[Candida] haemuloni var. vulneris]PVH18751.1 hypothetical protein CXQ85_001037 [[Candida] haemuloni]
MLRRANSEESLSTLISAAQSSATRDAGRAAGDDSSIWSAVSEETYSIGSLPLFGTRISAYTRIRELPILAGTLKSELACYLSTSVVKEGGPPLLTVHSNKFHFLARNAPLLTICRDGSDFCKVYFKIISNNLTCYVFMFDEGEKLFLFNNAIKPSSDMIYKGTRMRIFGASGAASTYGNGHIKAFALSDNSPVLADGLIPPDSAATIKDVKIKFSEHSPLYDAVTKQRKTQVSQILASGEPLVNYPVASFLDHGKQKVDGVKLDGAIRIFEANNGEDSEVSRDTLILTTVMLVLTEQEVRKMRGNNKPSYVRPPEHV